MSQVPGGSNKNNYANVDLIVDVAIVSSNHNRFTGIMPGNIKLPSYL